ncbi:MAG: ABC transporter permease [Porphyromonadaceae bacterium]|nr:MAG: ABC transporter permease [Porphyromonadaceae bacterium]
MNIRKSVVRLINTFYLFLRKYKSGDDLFSKRVDSFFIETYSIHKFIARFFKELFQKPSEFREIIRQCYEVGFKSIPLITLTGFVIGIVFTKQSRPPLVEFGAASWLPSLIGIAFVRALGPLVTALIAAGKVGSNIGAELGSMKVTEQIDAMDVSAVNPFKFLVVTRVVATTVMIPVLTLYCTFVGLLGSYLNVHQNELTSFVTFIESAFAQVSFLDVSSAVVKSVIYGFTIGIVGCYRGFNASHGTQGVGKAANRAVVFSMFLIFAEEMIVVQITNWIASF